jgi:hypothetical protein
MARHQSVSISLAAKVAYGAKNNDVAVEIAEDLHFAFRPQRIDEGQPKCAG